MKKKSEVNYEKRIKKIKIAIKSLFQEIKKLKKDIKEMISHGAETLVILEDVTSLNATKQKGLPSSLYPLSKGIDQDDYMNKFLDICNNVRI